MNETVIDIPAFPISIYVWSICITSGKTCFTEIRFAKKGKVFLFPDFRLEFCPLSILF